MHPCDRIIEFLYERREGGARDELAQQAGVSDANLDALLQELTRRGHRLLTSPDGLVRLDGFPALDAHPIERDLSTRRIGRNVICFSQLASTNDTAADSARQAGSDGLVVTAESQTQGRGRHGRTWRSPAGANLLASVVVQDPAERLPLEAVTVATGLAAAEAVDECLGRRMPIGRLKWPNDVLIDGRKVAGVLVEHRRLAGRRTLVLGVGVNVNAHPDDDQVDRPATSLAAQRGEPMDRIAVLRALLERLDVWICDLDADADATADRLREQWARRCGMMNQRHTIAERGRRYTGRVVDIDPLAGIVLLTDGGTQVRIHSEGATVIA